MLSKERQENLIIVAAIDKYARMHDISTIQAYEVFDRHKLFGVLRNNYETLHTQDLFEGARFADDYISRQK